MVLLFNLNALRKVTVAHVHYRAPVAYYYNFSILSLIQISDYRSESIIRSYIYIIYLWDIMSYLIN